MIQENSYSLLESHNTSADMLSVYS